MSKELGIPSTLYSAKANELRRKHEEIVSCDQVWLSDEMPENENMDSEVTELFNSKVLGYEKDFTDETVDITTEKKKNKEKPGNA